MMTAKEARLVAGQARLAAEKDTRKEQAEKRANDRIACEKYLEILENAVRSEALRGNDSVDYYVPYDNYFNKEVAKYIKVKLNCLGFDVETEHNDSLATGWVVKVKWEK